MRWSSVKAQLEMLLATLLIFSICQCQARPNVYDDVHEENEKDAWLAGVYQPQPLRPAPWQRPDAARLPNPASDGGLQIPGVGELIGLPGYKFIGNRPIDAYLGIRYAQVGSGLGRFQQARSVPYQGQVNATKASPNCAQFPELQRIQDDEARGKNVDDCLTLDVYAPSGASNLPVLVFVHGEMLFDGGSEEAAPDYFLEHDVVLVSINYRLAPFGFLSDLSSELPGNVALSDIHLALQWLQRNLRYFGGNPQQVTLVGQAGGATLVHALSLSGRAQNLFQQLILQSGTALNPYLIDERPRETLATFARIARCPYAGQNLSPLYNCLSQLRTSELLRAFQQLYEQNEPRGLTYLGGFKLVVGDSLGYLPQHPANLVVNNQNSSVPLIIGATKDASAFILSRFYSEVQRVQSRNVSDYINVVLRHTAPPQHHKIWHDWALREIFTPDQTPQFVNSQSISQHLLELSNLILYREPVIDSIRFTYKKVPTYLYIFDYRGQYHRFGHLNNPLPFGVDASLSDDSVYLFPYPVEASRLNPEDKSLARALVTMWVNFAQSGVPNPYNGVWPKASSEYGPFLRFTNSKESVLELDQHFGEGIYVPNLYGFDQILKSTTPQVSPTPTTTTTRTTTTTTTTRRPYAFNPYAQRPPQPSPQEPRRPSDQARYEQFLKAQERRRQQYQREQQERLERERAQQQLREQHEREEQKRQEEERLKQREQEAQREREEHEQRLQEERRRELQLQEERTREDQEKRLQQEREQEEREQHAQRPYETGPEEDSGYEPTPYPNYEDYVRDNRRQQEADTDPGTVPNTDNDIDNGNRPIGNDPSFDVNDPRSYSSYDAYVEAQMKLREEENRRYEEEQARYEQERQREEEERTRQQEEYGNHEPDQVHEEEEEQRAHETYGQGQQQGEQENNLREEDNLPADFDPNDPRSYPSYDAYVEAQMKLREEENRIYEQERVREEEERARQQEDHGHHFDEDDHLRHEEELVREEEERAEEQRNNQEEGEQDNNFREEEEEQERAREEDERARDEYELSREAEEEQAN
ncbi:uncharacterized protein Dwil_GK18669 [Drosophila willistoni]|uniref:Carboxylesterase type B domain-containing protein n=1 Tax=Drosophila willistoni TaxID=7260 RepID=B4N7S7_DROWI|nr:glutactin [Drosophila willistoni]EDW80416.1 uncharacterized protein Dwil_GK18669 [Drosophila willistoni]